jgi:hypothetical protein
MDFYASVDDALHDLIHQLDQKGNNDEPRRDAV